MRCNGSGEAGNRELDTRRDRPMRWRRVIEKLARASGSDLARRHIAELAGQRFEAAPAVFNGGPTKSMIKNAAEIKFKAAALPSAPVAIGAAARNRIPAE